MVQLSEIIEKIKTRQSVLNESDLSANCLTLTIDAIAPLATATPSQMAFIADAKYAPLLNSTQAGVVLLTEANWLRLSDDCSLSESEPESEPESETTDQKTTFIPIIVASPYLAYASCSQLFDGQHPSHRLTRKPESQPASQALSQSANEPINEPINEPATQQVINNDIHPTAVIASSAHIADGVVIGAHCVIGEGVDIGLGSRLGSHVTIGNHVKLGRNCVILPQVHIARDCVIGDSVRVHTGASIGAEGFGFAPTANPATTGWERIAQLGRVVIGDHVRIGANTCIDRGALSDTIIDNHVIIDNLVQIAHNVQIGAGTAIAAKTGIAGSTKIGKRCIIGGAVGITGHISITDDVTITAMTMVTKSIDKAGQYSSGIPIMPSTEWRKSVVMFKNLWKKR